MPLWHVTSANSLLLRYLLIENTAAGYKKNMYALSKKNWVLTSKILIHICFTWLDGQTYMMHAIYPSYLLFQEYNYGKLHWNFSIFSLSNYVLITSKDTLSTVFAENISFFNPIDAPLYLILSNTMLNCNFLNYISLSVWPFYNNDQ